MNGETEFTLIGELLVDGNVNTRKPMQLEFELPGYTSSALKVQTFQIQGPAGYQAVKWIRYITTSGQYLRRQ